MLKLVDEAERILSDKTCKLNEFGRMLDIVWKLKRKTGAKVFSSSSIDYLYDKAIKAGAIGGKLLGAGGGGFLLFYCEKDKQQAVIEALETLMVVPFNFENEGATFVLYNPIEYTPRKEIILRD